MTTQLRSHPLPASRVFPKYHDGFCRYESRPDDLPEGCTCCLHKLILTLYGMPTGMRYDVRQREGADDARSKRLSRHRPDAMDAELARTDRAQRLAGEQAPRAPQHIRRKA